MYFESQFAKENDLTEVYSYITGGWEWSEIVVFYSSEEKRYYWFSDSGCSCESFWDNIKTLSDFYDGDKFAAANAIKNFLIEMKEDETASVEYSSFIFNN